ncbi:MAG: DUF1963 domain-containing protein [bacterium]|nr:DUF1963 domain-containing protein [bacterium]
MEIGGFQPPVDPAASWFGDVKLSAAGEAWPLMGEKPMVPLCQVNLTNLPIPIPRLEDIALLTVFVGPEELPGDEPNGTNWAIRTYSSLEDLVPVEKPQLPGIVRPFPMQPRVLEADYPCYEDVAFELPPGLSEDYYDICDNVLGFKLGGWPTLIQSEIWWAPHNDHPASPEYVFQIDSTEKGNWMWGDSGVGYFGRGTTSTQRDEWSIQWQCY